MTTIPAPGRVEAVDAPSSSPPCSPSWLAPAASASSMSSDNVEFVKNFAGPPTRPAPACTDGFFYITTERDLTIYDVKEPENPARSATLTLPGPLGEPIFTEEDPDTNGKILLVLERRRLMVIDVQRQDGAEGPRHADGDGATSTRSPASWTAPGPTAPRARSSTCATRPSPKLAGNWNEPAPRSSSRHDVTEVSPGHRADLDRSRSCCSTRATTRRTRGPRDDADEAGASRTRTSGRTDGTDDFVLVGGEAIGPGCADDASATFQTCDARLAARPARSSRSTSSGSSTGVAARRPRARLDLLHALVRRAPRPTATAASWRSPGTSTAPASCRSAPTARSRRSATSSRSAARPRASTGSPTDVALRGRLLPRPRRLKFTGDIPQGPPRAGATTPPRAAAPAPRRPRRPSRARTSRLPPPAFSEVVRHALQAAGRLTARARGTRDRLVLVPRGEAGRGRPEARHGARRAAASGSGSARRPRRHAARPTCGLPLTASYPRAAWRRSRTPRPEYAALTERCGLVDRSERGKLALTGPDAKEFLPAR